MDCELFLISRLYKIGMLLLLLELKQIFIWSPPCSTPAKSASERILEIGQDLTELLPCAWLFLLLEHIVNGSDLLIKFVWAISWWIFDWSKLCLFIFNKCFNYPGSHCGPEMLLNEYSVGCLLRILDEQIAIRLRWSINIIALMIVDCNITVTAGETLCYRQPKRWWQS